jgi:hypothetical protein
MSETDKRRPACLKTTISDKVKRHVPLPVQGNQGTKHCHGLKKLKITNRKSYKYNSCLCIISLGWQPKLSINQQVVKVDNLHRLA